MSSFADFFQLQGRSTAAQQVPLCCPECECKEFYKQSDFKRSIGITLVSLASIMTIVLMAMGFNWFVIWSPMFLFLIFDRVLYRYRPLVAICYRCKHVLRGISKADLEELDGFELEIYDRYKYQEQNSQA